MAGRDSVVGALFSWVLGVKNLKKFCDVSRHAQIHRPALVVPLKFDAAE